MAEPPRFSSTYGLLDVEKGRKKLASHLKRHGPVRVLIEAEITDPFGSDDGTSIEFNMNVTALTILPPKSVTEDQPHERP